MLLMNHLTGNFLKFSMEICRWYVCSTLLLTLSLLFCETLTPLLLNIAILGSNFGTHIGSQIGAQCKCMLLVGRTVFLSRL